MKVIKWRISKQYSVCVAHCASLILMDMVWFNDEQNL